MIIITSDHGEEFLEHGGTGHGFTLYEEQLRVPLIIKPPLKKFRRAENESNTNVGIIDITPTVLDYLNLPLISTFEGRSLRPLIDTEIKTSTTYIAEAAIFHNMYATVQGGHKYIGNRFIPAKLLSPSLWFVTIRSFFKFKKDELYSIGNDPYEQNNLFEQEQELASVMRHDLLEHIKKSNAGQQIEINKETMEQLRSLGYIQ